MASSPFLRSPGRSSPQQKCRRSMDIAEGGYEFRDHKKTYWLSTAHTFGLGLVFLFFAGFLWIPSSVETKSVTESYITDYKVHPQVAPVGVPTSLHLLGERHSGTKWMYKHLHDCFGEYFPVEPGFSTWKHWFQKENNAIERAVVVAQFRNPYYWIEAMNRFPHHSPEHFDLDWKTFVTKPWTMHRFGADIQFEGATEATSEGILCKSEGNFGPHELIPCMANWTIVQDLPGGERRVTDAFYELRHDGSGRPYRNVLELRSDKIRNFLHVADFPNVKESYAVQYDEMATEGTEVLIRRLEESFQVKAKCDPYPAKGSPSRPLDPEYIAYIREHLDWDTEAMIGFTPDE